MVCKITWSPRALEDLRDAVRYIRRDDPEAARRFGLKLIGKAESLASFPERGRVIRKFQNPMIREIFLGPYRIAYRIRRDPASVEIVRLWHGARSEEEFEL
jgi:plasmid stabilization system protein ParE